MANDVFTDLAKKLKDLPDQVQNAIITATKKAVNEAGEKMEINLKRGAGTDTKLANHQLPAKITDNKYVYAYEVDWSDEIVNKNTSYPTEYAEISRLGGKRNYSRAPATWHDLAYIIDEGHVAPFSQTGVQIVAGTNFIKKARRNAKSWVKKRDIYATVELDIVANNLDKE